MSTKDELESLEELKQKIEKINEERKSYKTKNLLLVEKLREQGEEILANEFEALLEDTDKSFEDVIGTIDEVETGILKIN